MTDPPQHAPSRALGPIKADTLEAVTGLVLGALVGGIMGISASPIAKDVIVGLVALLGMFFGLTDKSGGTKSETRSETKSETESETKFETKSETSITSPEGPTGVRTIARIRLIAFCVGCLSFLGLGIHMRDTMGLVPIEHRPWHRLTFEQKIERIQARDAALKKHEPDDEQQRMKLLEEIERQDEKMVGTGNEAPTVQTGAAVRRNRKSDADVSRCTQYLQLLAAETPENIIEHYRTFPNGWEIDVANYVDQTVPPKDQPAALEVLTKFYCTP